MHELDLWISSVYLHLGATMKFVNSVAMTSNLIHMKSLVLAFLVIIELLKPKFPYAERYYPFFNKFFAFTAC